MNKKLLYRTLIALLLLIVVYIIGGRMGCWGRTPMAAGTLRMRTDSPVNNLNPFLNNSSGANLSVLQRIFMTLAETDPATLSLVPTMIKAVPTPYEVKDGPHKGCTAYDAEILDSAVWDNGTPVTAADIIFTFKTILHPKLNNAFKSYFEVLKTIEVDPQNPKKFTVYFSSYYLLGTEAICTTPILPAYHYDAQNLLKNIPLSDFTDKTKVAELSQKAEIDAFLAAFSDPKYLLDASSIVGNGPYKLEKHSENTCVLLRKTDWWGDKLVNINPLLGAYPERLSFEVVKEEPSIENMLKTQGLDMVAGSFTPASFKKWEADPEINKNYDFHVIDASGQYARIYVNLTLPKFQDKRVRQAIAHVINYEYILKEIQLGFGARAVSPIPASMPYFAKNIIPYPYSLQKAKDLLTEAGWTDTNGNGTVDKVINGTVTEMNIEVLNSKAPVPNMIANSIKDNALQAGINMTIVPADPNVIVERSGGEVANYEMVMGAAGLQSQPYDFYDRFHSSAVPPNGTNRSHYKNTVVDSLINIHRTTLDNNLRNQLYVKLQEIIYDDCPELFIYAPKTRVITAKKWRPTLMNSYPGFYIPTFKLN